MLSKKRKIIARKKGYTLVEMAAVMAIVAVISAIGAAALISSRGQAYADEAAESFVSSVRDSQNKAFAVTKNGTQDTKIWFVKLTNNNTCFEEGSIYKNLATLSSNTVITNCTNATISLYTSGGTLLPVSDTKYIAFSTPFGEGYLLNSTGAMASSWGNGNGNRPAKDYTPNTPESSGIVVRFTKGNARQDVVVEPNGDVYVK